MPVSSSGRLYGSGGNSVATRIVFGREIPRYRRGCPFRCPYPSTGGHMRVYVTREWSVVSDRTLARCDDRTAEYGNFPIRSRYSSPRRRGYFRPVPSVARQRNLISRVLFDLRRPTVENKHDGRDRIRVFRSETINAFLLANLRPDNGALFVRNDRPFKRNTTEIA